jgi:hypothetical protein
MISHLEERTKIKCALKRGTDENNDMTWILRQRSRGLISGKGKRFLLRNVQTGCEAYIASYSKDDGILSWR